MMIFVVLLTGFCQLPLNAKALDLWCPFNSFSHLRFITVLGIIDINGSIIMWMCWHLVSLHIA